QVSTLRDVNIDDLLRRDLIKIDIDIIASDLTDKVVLVTGAAGSIGSELVRQICKFKPKEIVLLDINENGLHDMHLELARKFPNQLYRCVIANIRERERLREVFEETKPSIVFHAAAHKHVPMMEYNPGEAVKNNVFGTLNVALQASESNAKRFVLISTDKAVNPTNVMGATKRAAEKIIQSLGQKSSTIFTAVRFGNVLGSNGSVVPLFKQQIANGGPVTVTHPEIKRYFMTIPEACQLVLQAGINADQGEVYVLDMGEPVKIVDLATAMIELSGYKVGEDIDIEYVGLRPGEKLFEELFADKENSYPTNHSKVFRAHLETVNVEDLLNQLEDLKNTLELGNHTVMRERLKKIVPSYSADFDKILEEVAATRNY
ncbi:MAG: nucleoside-diphosphate sugar epimerase/dehydratase, partial [Firmicutes bacterium]|nr:nucleoside-diphosphate sugar epimerase/dehydratase [Bacillota bacterium]